MSFGLSFVHHQSIQRFVDDLALSRQVAKQDGKTAMLPYYSLLPVLSGVINSNFLLKTANKRFLLKVYAADEQLAVDRTSVFELQSFVAKANLAPLPIAHTAQDQIYIESWINSFRSYEHLNLSEQLVGCARALSSIHSLEIDESSDIHQLDLLAHWSHYKQSINNCTKEFDEQFRLQYQNLSDYINKHHDEFVLCHNDLQAAHVCANSGMVIDWEYSGKFCRYFDLANTIIANGFNQESSQKFIDTYCQLANYKYDEVWQRVQISYNFSLFTHSLWSISTGLETDLE